MFLRLLKKGKLQKTVFTIFILSEIISKQKISVILVTARRTNFCNKRSKTQILIDKVAILYFQKMYLAGQVSLKNYIF